MRELLDARCSSCHTRERVEQAAKSGANFEEITARMVGKGARLTRGDKKVLGTFWGEAFDGVKQPATSSGFSDPRLADYRKIVENQCLTCHPKQRIEESIAAKLPFESVEAMMLRRGVVLSTRDKSVLGTFWGSPLN